MEYKPYRVIFSQNMVCVNIIKKFCIWFRN